MEKFSSYTQFWSDPDVDPAKRGWFTIRGYSYFFVQLLVFEGIVHAQFTPHENVFQIRLTAKGRTMIREARSWR
jgi:hypothetical protein